jgi:hypothetical protein
MISEQLVDALQKRLQKHQKHPIFLRKIIIIIIIIAYLKKQKKTQGKVSGQLIQRKAKFQNSSGKRQQESEYQGSVNPLASSIKRRMQVPQLILW